MAANTKTDQVQVFINCYCYYYYYYFAARLSPSRIVRLKSLLRNRGVNRLTARWLKSNPSPPNITQPIGHPTDFLRPPAGHFDLPLGRSA